MTGEISLRGRVLPIGGLKEKTMAAYSAGVRTVLIPKDNERDLDRIDPLARENLRFIPCTRAADVLKEALLRPEVRIQTEPSVIVPSEQTAGICPGAEHGTPQPSARFHAEENE